MSINSTDIENYDSSESDVEPIEECSSAIIPWLLSIHNISCCIYFFYKFGCCRNTFAVSTGMKRSASFVFITHAITPFYMGFSNFHEFIYFVNDQFNIPYPCRIDFMVEILLFALCKFGLFLFFTFRVDVILRDSFFEYKRKQSWLLRFAGFVAFVFLMILN